MDWNKRLETNPKRHGDPVTALYLPSGGLIATGFIVTPAAVKWILGLLVGEDRVGDILPKEVEEKWSTTEVGLHLLADLMRLGPHPFGQGTFLLEGADSLPDGARFAVAHRNNGSHAVLCVRLHDANRDGTPTGPPMIAIEWEAPGPGRDEALRIPESLAAAVRHCSVAWPDTRQMELESVVFTGTMPMGTLAGGRWSMAGVEWPAHRGGIMRFNDHGAVTHLVTLPRQLTSSIVHAVADRHTLYGGEEYYLNDTRPHQYWQKF